MKINPLYYPGIIFDIRFKPVKSSSLKLQTIESIVCRVFGFTPQEMNKEIKHRKRELVKARQIFHYLAKKYTPMSLYQIGAYYHKDHATVLHSCRVVTNIVETKDKDFYPLLLEAENRLQEFIQNNYDYTTQSAPKPSHITATAGIRKEHLYQFNRVQDPRRCKPALPGTRTRTIAPPYFRTGLRINATT